MWNVEFFRPLRAVLGLHRPPPDDGCEYLPVSAAAVCRQLEVPLPEVVLLAARLSFAIRVAVRPGSFITAIYRCRGGDSWRAAVARGCQFLQAMLA